jgi:hypothetical protein
LHEICRSVLGSAVISCEPIVAGRNSRVFRVDLDDMERGFPRRVVVKFYRRDAGDSRDRLGTEFASLQFLWRHDVRAIPFPIAAAPDRQCAIFEYIPGEVATSAPVAPEDVDASVDFLQVLKDLRGATGSDTLPRASDAWFTLEDIAASVDRRLERLRRVRTGGEDVTRLQRWIDATLVPLGAEVHAWCRATARRCRIGFDEAIGCQARTLSPSDFGFHNAIRRPDGSLVFVDFEYFGWDDPAKMVADYLLHPGMVLDDDLRRRFAVRVLQAFAGVPALADRVRIVFPLFGLKWGLILLNDFLPERFSQSTGERRLSQLEKAQTFVGRLAGEYADNPFLF